MRIYSMISFISELLKPDTFIIYTTTSVGFLRGKLNIFTCSNNIMICTDVIGASGWVAIRLGITIAGSEHGHTIRTQKNFGFIGLVIVAYG